ncbi:MAG TPA: mandelate racemase/muconate lactonizing enzyme family protein [Terriglobia bacterium]|nr:mandelate racemase/muconate lactonizing enzyme family protein [Terriglobia bacterium]
MKITKVETIRYARQPNLLWVRLHTDDGLIGLGETYYLPGAVEAVVHDLIAEFLLGSNPFDLESLWDNVFSWTNFFGYAGAEMRALSAVNIAMWDLAGQSVGQPVYNLLGGMCRDRLRVYNTCVSGGPYTDFTDFIERPAELARSLYGQGIKAMKIWPWDRFGPHFQTTAPDRPTPWAELGPSGAYISAEDVEAGLEPVRKIRGALGNKMEILIEGHSRWDLNCALRIARALEPYDVLWMEDMIKPTNARDLARLATESRVPHCVSERLFTRYAFREVLEAHATRVVMPDLIWTGGITEGRKIAILADTFHLPIAPHDCSGLVTIFANLHLCASVTNAMILETVRGFYHGWYSEAYTQNVVIREGYAQMPTQPGLGTSLREEFLNRDDVSMRVSKGTAAT